jgi:hypothetical protein
MLLLAEEIKNNFIKKYLIHRKTILEIVNNLLNMLKDLLLIYYMRIIRLNFDFFYLFYYLCYIYYFRIYFIDG